MTEFYGYLKNGRASGPVLVSLSRESMPSATSQCETRYTTQHWTTFGPDFYIAFDTRLNIDPYKLYMNGELSIQYLLSQDALVSKKPTIKCDMIEAKNALKLHESDVHYLYKPTIITEQT